MSRFDEIGLHLHLHSLQTARPLGGPKGCLNAGRMCVEGIKAAMEGVDEARRAKGTFAYQRDAMGLG